MRGNSLEIDVGIEWESGNWTGFPCDLLPKNFATRTVRIWLGWPPGGPPLPSARLRWVSQYCGLYSGSAHVSPEAAGDGGPVRLVIQGVSFSQNVQKALRTILQQVSTDPAVYKVELLFSFKGMICRRSGSMRADRSRA